MRTGPGQWFAGICRHIRTAADDLRMRSANACGDPLRGRPLHHRRLLVHRVNVIRQSRRDHRSRSVGYLRGHRPGWRARRSSPLSLSARLPLRRWRDGYSQERSKSCTDESLVSRRRAAARKSGGSWGPPSFSSHFDFAIFFSPIVKPGCSHNSGVSFHVRFAPKDGVIGRRSCG